MTAVRRRRATLAIPNASLLSDLRRALDAADDLEHPERAFSAIANALSNPKPGFVRAQAIVPSDPAPEARIEILVGLLNRLERQLPCSARFEWSASVDLRRGQVALSRQVRPERDRDRLLATIASALVLAFPDRADALFNTFTDRLDTSGWFIPARKPLRATRANVETLPAAVVDLANRLEPERNPALWALETRSRHAKLLWTVVASWPRP